jgi:hypothetical protein
LDKLPTNENFVWGFTLPNQGANKQVVTTKAAIFYNFILKKLIKQNKRTNFMTNVG